MNRYGYSFPGYPARQPLQPDSPLIRGCNLGVYTRAILSILLLWILSAGISASQENWRIVNYSLEDGLSQISVNTIMQSSDGFLWIGTQDGLNRFDGYGFKVYRHQPSDTSSLSDSHIWSVIEDDNGNLWIGTQDGLNMYDRNSGTVMVYRNEPGNPLTLSDNNIYYVYRDSRGMIWLKTEEGIDMFDPEAEVFVHYEHYYDVFNYISGSNYFSVYEDRYDNLWVGTKDGLMLFDRDTEQFTRYHHDRSNPLSLSNDKVKSIYETSAGDLLVGTESGLNVFDRQEESFHPYFVEPPDGSYSRLNVINSVFEDSNGTIWVGTEAGLFTFSPANGRFTPFSGRAVTGTHFDQEVSSILEDRSGNLWIGSLGGLYMIDSKSKFNIYRIHDYMPAAPPAARYIASVFPYSDHELWLGTWGAGLFILNRSTGDIRHYSGSAVSDSQRISNDFVHVIFADSEGRIILGTRDGLDIFMGYQSGFEPYCPAVDKDDCSIFRSNRIYSMYEDPDRVTWIGTRYGLHSLREGSMTSYYHNPQDSATIPSNQVHDITECIDGYLWIATANGLSRFDRKTGLFKNYHKDPGMGRFSLSHNELTCLHEDAGGNLWVGSVAGLNRFFKHTGSFMVFSEMEGLPNNLIYSILEDDEGMLWLSTNMGLARFDPMTLESFNYDVGDGLQSYEFNLGSGIRSESGELFFGGVDGLNAFFPDSMKLNETIPPLVITMFEIISPEGRRVISAGNNDEIILNPRENSVNIEFAALDFSRPGKNSYAYRLEGLDDKWIYSGNRRLANYSRIPPGTYVFRVKGSNNDDVWNEEGVSLKIIVKTPVSRSFLAWVLYAGLVLFFIYLLVLFSTRQLRSANQILREKEQASLEISRQKEELTVKNRNITDSINYARRIQLAMMPTSRNFKRVFHDSFVYYKPKDIVSGDFYWVNQRNDKVFFGVIDCTGHGVPGAFMSIIGYELLRNIITQKGFEKPAEILNRLNEDFSYIFDSDGEKNYTFRDGMDIGFCVIDRKNALMEFAGAFSTLYLIRDRSIIEIKGNRFSVGLMEDLINEPFENHRIELEKNDLIYLFSDGYPDQFGGEDGKKFKYRRFRHLLLNIHSLPLDEQEKMLDQSMVQWQGNHEQVDDILVIGVKPGLGS